MHVLVTGGAGYVGSRVTAHLLAKGSKVTVLDSLVYGAMGLLPFAGNPSFRLIVGDVRDVRVLQGAMNTVDAVVHLAAIVGEPACSLDPGLAEQVNRESAISALELADSLGIDRFVFVSTCSNYGVSEPNVLADEDAVLSPLSLYAQTKVDVETAALERALRTAVTVLRFGTICGLSGRMRFDLLISEMARAAALGTPIEVYKPDAWRPFLHVIDAGRAIELVLASPLNRVRRRVFNVVGENYQKRGLIELVQRNYPETPMTIVDSVPDNRDYRVSAERIRRELGFDAVRSVKDAFMETAQAVADGIFIDPFWAGHSAIPVRANHRFLKA